MLKNIIIVAEINELKSSFCAVLFHCFSTVMHNNFEDKYLEISRMLSHADMQNMETSLEPFHIVTIPLKNSCCKLSECSIIFLKYIYGLFRLVPIAVAVGGDRLLGKLYQMRATRQDRSF